MSSMLTWQEFDEAVKAIRRIVKPRDFRRGKGDTSDAAVWSDERLASAFGLLRPAEFEEFLNRVSDLQFRGFLGRFGEIMAAYMEYDGTNLDDLFAVIAALPPGAGFARLRAVLARREKEFDQEAEAARGKGRDDQRGKYIDIWLATPPEVEMKTTDHLSLTQKVAGVLATRPGTSAAAIIEYLGIGKTKKNLNKIRAITSRLRKSTC